MRISLILGLVEGIIVPHHPQQPEIEHRITQHLKNKGVRATRARRLVIRALRRAPGPQSASALHRKLRPAVPLSSLYRTLAILDEAGVLERSHGGGGVARYELAQWLTGHHDHLVCMECGTTEDVDLGRGLERAIAGFVTEVAARSDFRLTGHSLELEGLCGACRG